MLSAWLLFLNCGTEFENHTQRRYWILVLLQVIINLKKEKKRKDFLIICTGSSHELTDGPLLIQTPLSKAVHQPDLVVLVASPPGGLEDLDARGQTYVVLVVVAPGGDRQLQLTVEVRQVVQIHATQRLQAAAESKREAVRQRSRAKVQPLQQWRSVEKLFPASRGRAPPEVSNNGLFYAQDKHRGGSETPHLEKPSLLLNLLVESTRSTEVERPRLSLGKTKSEKGPAGNGHAIGGNLPRSHRDEKLPTIAHCELFK